MGHRCPTAKIVGTAVIKNYRLVFKGSKTGSYLSIQPAKGCEVPVAVWDVKESDIRSLDRYEGYPHFYFKQSMTVDCSDGKRHRCFVYIMNYDRPYGIPSYYYVDICLHGYEEFGFDKHYIYDAINFSKKICLV
jgi:gamma-glutamylcyclotransferase (GGCT)/AIG2-like uncharacterized protein YtfP